DSALFHIFDDRDRAAYVRSLYGATHPGSVVHVLALSDAGRGFGPEVSEATIRGAFEGTGWEIEDLATVTYRGVVT
ncbi:SAM-dependent methyltransferase, partial [Mycobacterium sp. ITM-2017-0098]